MVRTRMWRCVSPTYENSTAGRLSVSTQVFPGDCGFLTIPRQSCAAWHRDTRAAIIEGGRAAGEFDVDDVDEVVIALSSLCVDVCRWFPSRTNRDPRKVGEMYARVAERMVR